VFRENEQARVGAVKAARHDGQIDALIDAAIAFWIHPLEREDVGDAPDREVWSELEAGHAVEAACLRAHELVRNRVLLRPEAYIRIIEASEPTIALGLADAVLAAGWPAQPYLATIFARMIDADLHVALCEWIKTNSGPLTARLDTWVLCGFTLTTSRVGTNSDVAAWFENWEQRERVPMWLIALYLGSIAQQYDRASLVPFERLRPHVDHVRERGVTDSTEGLFILLHWIDLLRKTDFDTFVAEYEQRGVTLPALADAVIEYASSARRARSVTKHDVDYRPPVGREIRLAQRPWQWRLGAVLFEIREITSNISRAVEPFYTLLTLQPGDQRVLAIAKRMRARLPDVPWIQVGWNNAFAARASFGRRILFALGIGG